MEFRFRRRDSGLDNSRPILLSLEVQISSSLTQMIISSIRVVRIPEIIYTKKGNSGIENYLTTEIHFKGIDAFLYRLYEILECLLCHSPIPRNSQPETHSKEFPAHSIITKVPMPTGLMPRDSHARIFQGISTNLLIYV